MTIPFQYANVPPVVDSKVKTTRSITFPADVWKALDADASACRRSSVKQMEAILTVYYGLDDVELGDIAAVRETVSPYLAKAEQTASGKDPRKGRAFLERVLREMDEEESAEDTKGGDRKTGNG